MKNQKKEQMKDAKKNQKKNKVKFRSIYTHKKVNYGSIAVITIITFFMAIILGYFSIVFMEKVSLFFATIILLVIVFLGVFFDLLGIAVTAAEEISFHSMASNRVKGAKESVLIIRNAGTVANIFNDVVGDISGIISGSALTVILVKINEHINVETTVVSIILTGVVAAITVGGKAIGKEIALRKSNFIVYKIGCLLSVFSIMREKGRG
jgi:hypothetical protein